MVLRLFYDILKAHVLDLWKWTYHRISPTTGWALYVNFTLNYGIEKSIG